MALFKKDSYSHAGDPKALFELQNKVRFPRQFPGGGGGEPRGEPRGERSPFRPWQHGKHWKAQPFGPAQAWQSTRNQTAYCTLSGQSLFSDIFRFIFVEAYVVSFETVAITVRLTALLMPAVERD